MFAACGCVYAEFLSLGTSACLPSYEINAGACVVVKGTQNLYLYVCAPFMPTLISSCCICSAECLRKAHTNSASHATCGRTHLWAF